MKWFVRLVALIALVVSTSAQEKLVLTSPIPSTTEYRVADIQLTWGETLPDDCRISIRLLPNVTDGTEKRHTWRGATACTMLKALNTANFSSKSLQRRIIEQLVTDSVLVGTPTGTPEK